MNSAAYLFSEIHARRIVSLAALASALGVALSIAIALA